MSEKPDLSHLSPSPRCLYLEEAADVYLSRLKLILYDFVVEREEMIAQNVDRDDQDFVMLEREWNAVLGVVNAVAQENTKVWSRLNSKRVTPAP